MKTYCSCCGKLFSGSMTHRRLNEEIEVCDSCYDNLNKISNGELDASQIDLSNATEAMEKWLKRNIKESKQVNICGNSDDQSKQFSIDYNDDMKQMSASIQQISKDIHFIKTVVLVFSVLYIIGVLVFVFALL